MAFRWSEDITIKFIRKYLEHECLWNIKSPFYKNKQIKQSAYIELEKAMGIPGFTEKEVRIKIKNIRSTYSQEKKKIRDSRNSGNEIVYIPSLKWFNLLDSSLRNITSYITKCESIYPYEECTYTDNTDTEENGKDAVDPFIEYSNTRPPTKKKKISQGLSIDSQLKEICETDHSIADESEFEVFGKHVALQLKSLPILMALEAQEHIQLYMNRIRRRHLMNNAVVC